MQRSWLLTFCMILFNGGKRNYALVYSRPKNLQQSKYKKTLQRASVIWDAY